MATLVFSILFMHHICLSEALRFGNTQNHHMVLQQAPHRSQIWGFSSPNDTIIVSLRYQSNFSLIEQFSSQINATTLIWKQYLSPRVALNDIEYLILATSVTDSTTIHLAHVLFGDVFMCSGQSNMQFTVDSAFNATEECKAANAYHNIRVASVASAQKAQASLETNFKQIWSISHSSSICNGNWTYFSAVCWFYGRELYSFLNYPIGLIDASLGGTPIRAWMSLEARAICNESNANCPLAENVTKDTFFLSNDVEDSSLYNSMIFPFTQSTIKGAVWFQGERDSKEPYCAKQYHCAIPQMINNWREEWHLRSDTDPLFPFGYVQLSTWNCDSQDEICSSAAQRDNDDCYDIGLVRWGQSANFGYVPNKLMPNTFMASAIDLGDPSSPWGGIHSRYKQTVGKRLADAAKNIVYNRSDVYFQGPIADKFVVDIKLKIGIVSFRNVGKNGLEVKHFEGFEFYTNNVWIAMMNATAFFVDGLFDIVIPLSSMHDDLVANIEMIRYEWFHCPCFQNLGPFNCPIYDKQHQLPALPFIISVLK